MASTLNTDFIYNINKMMRNMTSINSLEAEKFNNINDIEKAEQSQEEANEMMEKDDITMDEKEDPLMNHGGRGMKKVVISDDCSACGICSIGTDLIYEGSDGRAVVREPGIVIENQLEKIQEIINNCPSKAIQLEDHRGIVSVGGHEGLEELKTIILEKLGQYTVSMPPKKDYAFNKDYFHFPYMGSGRGAHQYEYSSDKKAESAGLSEFNAICYSRSKVLIQALFVRYKDIFLRRYYEYEKTPGNFYHTVNQEIGEFLKQVIAEAQNISNNKLILPKEFEDFEVVPRMGLEKGDKTDRELYIYQLIHFEEMYLVDDVVRERESLEWYRTYINTYDTRDYRDKTKYAYDVSEAIEAFEKWTISDIGRTINYNIEGILETPIKYFNDDVQKELKEKVEILIKAIDEVII